MVFRNTFTVAGLLLTMALAGCSTTTPFQTSTASYSSVSDAAYVLPTIPVQKIAPEYRRQRVKYETAEAPGTIVVDTQNKFLYHVEPDGKAMRYGIGVGREGFQWKGSAKVAMKREWPTWTPPAPMIKRQPELAKYAGGMKPGLTNPLGARALYLYKGGRDSGYRLHGTPEWWSIGKNVSSGCIRLINQDIMDLYERSDVGAKVVVL
ncbi:L,D-transpeptidase [Pseudochrobactrum sp. sp1633]|uniref:L,D-transpeptidase n=1 Tax=Pseudochrobactrum sp. sp1633 TaxID=3036706 RepID=UPI0025A589D8|nr:L,D-transpeptidase [Pseudochrobactrum sp. sp1633]MDM8344294.1 L,D-transpeptidase [Pseudochrobactrum sp. sp1633]HWD14573.1 L,D-transpeptidase [Pseudochrobactrum sp.]